MLYLVCYDQAAEENEDFAMEDRVVFTTCNKDLADSKLEEFRKQKPSAFLMEYPFEEDCDELLAMYYE